MDTYYAEFRARARLSEPHEHIGAELVYVISGELVINIDGESRILNEGDSIYFIRRTPTAIVAMDGVLVQR